MSIFARPRMPRRLLLAAGSGAALLAGGASLTGCGSGTSARTNTADKNDAVTLPTYIEYQGAKPDLPGTEEGVDDAYRTWPSDNPKIVKDKPGTGKETVSGMTGIYYAVPPGPDKNSFWAGLNKRLGVDLKLQMVGYADYPQKYATTIAGQDLPDAMRMVEVANFPSLLDKRFTPLEEYLGGDAVKDYPCLANIPTRTWKATIYNGHIYGIPIPASTISTYNFIREDLFDAKSLPTAPKGFQEFVNVAKELTEPKKRRWAFARIGDARSMIGRMNGEPNGWRYEDGKLTEVRETEEYKQSLSDLIKLWKSGVIHPDGFDAAQPFKQLFNSGTCAVVNDGDGGWTQYQQENESNAGLKMGLMPTYNREGSELAPWPLGTGMYSFTGLKKQDDPDKIKLILRVLNWLATPFGTEEYLYRVFGEEGVDHKMSDGNPVLTKTGQSNTVIPIRFLADSPGPIYEPGRPEDADAQHKYQSMEIPVGISNPTTGLFSNAKATQSSSTSKNFDDARNQIIQGRKPLSDLDDMIKAWRSGGGDDMRKEYQDQLQKNGGPK